MKVDQVLWFFVTASKFTWGVSKYSVCVFLCSVSLLTSCGGGGSGGGTAVEVDEADTITPPINTLLNQDELSVPVHTAYTVSNLQYVDMLVHLSNLVVDAGKLLEQCLDSSSCGSLDNITSMSEPVDENILGNYTLSYRDESFPDYGANITGAIEVETTTWSRVDSRFELTLVLSFGNLQYVLEEQYDVDLSGSFEMTYVATESESHTVLSLLQDIEVAHQQYDDRLSVFAVDRVIDYRNSRYSVDLDLATESGELGTLLTTQTYEPLVGQIQRWPHSGAILSTGFHNDHILEPIFDSETLGFTASFSIGEAFVDYDEVIDWKLVSSMSLYWDRRFPSVTVTTGGENRGDRFLTIKAADSPINLNRDYYGLGVSQRPELIGYTNIIQEDESLVFYSNLEIDSQSVPDIVSQVPQTNSALLNDEQRENIDYDRRSMFNLEATTGYIKITPVDPQLNVPYHIEFDYEAISGGTATFGGTSLYTVRVGEL